MLSVVLYGCQPSEEEVQQSFGEDLEEFLGFPARVVWVQDTGSPGGGDYQATGNKNLRLMGLDSKDGIERILYEPTEGNIHGPRFAPDGESVFFSDRQQGQIFQLDWPDGQPVHFGPGKVLATWQDTSTQQTWIYYTRASGEKGKEPLFRRPIGNAAGTSGKEELVWDKTPVNRLDISADGRILGVEFTWPESGIIDLATGQWERLGTGCLPSLAPDNSYLYWIFTGTHRSVDLFSLRQGQRWNSPLTRHPDLEGRRIYHPRWTNHPRFMVFNGPFRTEFWANRNEVDLFLGRWDEDYRSLSDWFRLTNNSLMDTMPDVWINHNL